MFIFKTCLCEGDILFSFFEPPAALIKIIHLWDLRWQEENRAIAQGSADLQQHDSPYAAAASGRKPKSFANASAA